MNVIYGIGKVKRKFKNAVVVLGVFDGVHRGHQALISAAVKRAKSIDGDPVVMTFVPHPMHVLHPHIRLPYILSVSCRLRLIARLGVCACVVIRFTKRFAHLTPDQFVKRYLVSRIRPREIFVGSDFRFGKNRSGSLEDFQEAGCKYGFKVHGVGLIRGDHRKIGSSVIRRLILEGKLQEARKLLGYRVSLMGRVVKGDGRGKTLGFPTANIHSRGVVTPPRGVYAVNVGVGRHTYPGMANVGHRPSFKTQNHPLGVEVHLLNFKGNLYKKEILVEFVQKIREEQIFPSKKELTNQLKKDRVRVREILRRIS